MSFEKRAAIKPPGEWPILLVCSGLSSGCHLMDSAEPAALNREVLRDVAESLAGAAGAEERIRV